VEAYEELRLGDVVMYVGNLQLNTLAGVGRLFVLAQISTVLARCGRIADRAPVGAVLE
jgi:hypothetical protein